MWAGPNSLRDLIAEILEEVCSDVEVEPPLLPLTEEKLPKGSITSPGARLDVSARNLWSPLAKAFIEVRVVNPETKAKSIPQMYKSHEEEKKQGYLSRVLQVEKGTFTLAVFSTSAVRMAERMSILREPRGENYSSVVSFLRRRFRLALRPLEDVRNCNEGLQEANYHCSEYRYPRLRLEDNRFVLLRR